MPDLNNGEIMWDREHNVKIVDLIFFFQILVKVKACGINPVDTYIRQGEFMVLPDLPTILGKEAAGVVEQVGSDVNGVKVSIVLIKIV